MTPPSTKQLRQRLSLAWDSLQARERRSVILAGSVIALALLWWLLIAPPLALLKTATAERDALRVQSAHMQSLKQEADALQALPKLGHDDAWRALEQATQQHLGEAASLNRSGEQAQVALDEASADELASWLAAVRVNARAIPTQARLQQAANTDDGAPPRWSGTLTLALPS